VALSKCGNKEEESGLIDQLTAYLMGYQLYLMFDQVATDAARYDYSIALLTIRMDDSKLRRRWGHAVGDEAVRASRII